MDIFINENRFNDYVQHNPRPNKKNINDRKKTDRLSSAQKT